MTNLILKYFLNNKFYKIIFETQFCRSTRFTKKLRYGLYTDFWNDFWDVTIAGGLHGSQFWAIHNGYRIVTGYRWITTWLLRRDKLLDPTRYWRVADFEIVHPIGDWMVANLQIVHPTGYWRVADLWLVHPTRNWRVADLWIVLTTRHDMITV